MVKTALSAILAFALVFSLSVFLSGGTGVFRQPSVVQASVFTPTHFAYLPIVMHNWGGCNTPTLISPTNGSRLNSIAPLFTWRSNNLENVQLLMRVAENPEFQDAMLVMFYSASTEAFRFPFNLKPGTTHYWQMWARCEGVESPRSPVWSFTTGAKGVLPSSPLLVAPANNSNIPVGETTLRWNPVSNAEEYLIHWWIIPEAKIHEWTTETLLPLSALTPNTTYYWNVAARNPYGIGRPSPTWQFTTFGGTGQFSTTSYSQSGKTIVIKSGVIIAEIRR